MNCHFFLLHHSTYYNISYTHSPFLYVECTVGVPGNISASAAHRLAELARNEMMTRFVCTDTALFFCPSARLSVCPCVHLPLRLFVCLSVCVALYLSIVIILPVSLSMCLSVYPSACVCKSYYGRLRLSLSLSIHFLIVKVL